MNTRKDFRDPYEVKYVFNTLIVCQLHKNGFLQTGRNCDTACYDHHRFLKVHFMCFKRASSKKKDGLPVNKGRTFENFVYCNLKDLQDSTR